jgi:hypothetical protein
MFRSIIYSLLLEFGKLTQRNIVYINSKQLNEIYLKGNYRDYQLGLTVKKALFGSYSLEDWWLVKR